MVVSSTQTFFPATARVQRLAAVCDAQICVAATTDMEWRRRPGKAQSPQGEAWENALPTECLSLECGADAACLGRMTWSSVAYFKMLWHDGHRAIELPEDYRQFYTLLTRRFCDIRMQSTQAAYDEALVCRRVGLELGVAPDSPLHGKMVSYPLSNLATGCVYTDAGDPTRCRLRRGDAFGERRQFLEGGGGNRSRRVRAV